MISSFCLKESVVRENLNKACSQSGVSSLTVRGHWTLTGWLGATVPLNISLPRKNCFSLITVTRVYLCGSLVCAGKECNTIVVRLQALINLNVGGVQISSTPQAWDRQTGVRVRFGSLSLAVGTFWVNIIKRTLSLTPECAELSTQTTIYKQSININGESQS